jgi:hypothetical protein
VLNFVAAGLTSVAFNIMFTGTVLTAPVHGSNSSSKLGPVTEGAQTLSVQSRTCPPALV